MDEIKTYKISEELRVNLPNEYKLLYKLISVVEELEARVKELEK